MKKLKNASLFLIVFCVMLFCTTPYASGVETGTTADGWKYSLEFGKLFITGYEGTIPADGSLTIPSSLTINGQSINVLGIGSGAFNSNNLKSIIISNGIVSIGGSAFYYCRGLESISIPNSVSEIGESAFYECKSLKTVTIPGNVQSISSSTFNWCTSLSSVSLPQSITEIGYSAFSDCSSLTSINIPDNVKSIGPYAFANCNGLESINIPDKVKSIGYSAFLGCSSLTSINIPDNVKSIESYAFANCNGLESINIPDGIEDIEDNAFLGCSSLSNVTIPNSVTYIRYDAFYNCTSLKTVTLSGFLDSIGNHAFGYYLSAGGTYVKIPGFTIKGYKGTTAETYADDNGFNFEELSCDHIWSEWETVQYPYYGQEGLKKRTCSKCGSTETETIPVPTVSPTPTATPIPTATPTPTWIPYTTTPTITPTVAPVRNPIPYSYDHEKYGYKVTGFEKPVKIIGGESISFTVVGAHVSPSDQPYVKGDAIWRPMYMELLTKEDGDVVSRFTNSDTTFSASHTFMITPSATLVNRTEPLYFRITYREYAWNGTTFAFTENLADETFELRIVYITATPTPKVEPTQGPVTYRNLTVTIKWDDANNKDDLRPGRVDVYLYADGKNTGKTFTLMKSGNWSGTLKRLIDTEDGEKVAYTVYSDRINGYNEPEYSKDASGNITITMKHTVAVTTPGSTPTPTVLPPTPTVPPTPIPTVAPPAVSEIISGAAKYRIDNQKKTAVLIAPAKKSITSLSVPATIKYNGMTYKVTEISAFSCKGLKKLKKVKIGKNVKIVGDGAFSGCTALTESEIGANVQIIGKGAFTGCKKQKTVKFKGSKVKTIGQNAFKGNAAKVTFKCPAKKLKAYTILIKAAGAPKKAKYTK